MYHRMEEAVSDTKDGNTTVSGRDRAGSALRLRGPSLRRVLRRRIHGRAPEILALERLADRDGKSADTILARELLDVVSAHSEYLAKAIPGFTAALRWPQ
jgi:hypothetical protein